MSVMEPRYDKHEFARRGEEIYARDVQPHLHPDDDGKFVAIDIDTAIHEADRDDFTATERVLRRNPNAQIWLMRVGEPAAHRLGGR